MNANRPPQLKSVVIGNDPLSVTSKECATVYVRPVNIIYEVI